MSRSDFSSFRQFQNTFLEAAQKADAADLLAQPDHLVRKDIAHYDFLRAAGVQSGAGGIEIAGTSRQSGERNGLN